MNTRTPEIVVGVSGSQASVAALRWAADEAERVHGTIRVVLAWTPEPHAYYARVHEAADRDLQERGRRALEAAVRHALGPQDHPNVTASVVKRMPERALVDSSAGADLLVLGSESGLTAGRSIGPVIRACLSRAYCPVVVISPETFSHRDGLPDEAHGLSYGNQFLLATGAVPPQRSGS